MPNPKWVRKFYRRIIASEMEPYLKSGCDMGLYDHFKGPVHTPKLNSILWQIIENQEPLDPRINRLIDQHFWELG